MEFESFFLFNLQMGELEHDVKGNNRTLNKEKMGYKTLTRIFYFHLSRISNCKRIHYSLIALKKIIFWSIYKIYIPNVLSVDI